MTHPEPPRNTSTTARRARYAAREALWDFSSLSRVRACGRKAAEVAATPNTAVTRGGAVGREPVVHLMRTATPEGGYRASWAGVQSCGSVHACPVCAEKIQAHRQSELIEALAQADRLGLRAAFVSMTVRHRRGQSLGRVWAAVSGAWRATVSGSRQWREDRDRFGVEGYVRLVEVTHGGNGWHVHVHALVFFADDAGLGWARAAEQLGQRMGARWSTYLARTEFAPSRAHGVDARLLVATERLAAYFTKGLYDVKTPESTAYDVTSSAGKTASRGNVTPFGLLARLIAQGDAADLDLWREWERESRGKRQLVWSNGLRALLLPGVEDQSDEAVAEASEPEAHVLVTVTGRAYSRLARAGVLAAALDAAEKPDDGHALWALLDRFGVREWSPPVPLAR